MSYLPTEHALMNLNFKYIFDNYDVRLYVSSSVGAAKGFQIIDGTGTYVGLDDGNGAITWNQVA